MVFISPGGRYEKTFKMLVKMKGFHIAPRANRTGPGAAPRGWRRTPSAGPVALGNEGPAGKPAGALSSCKPSAVPLARHPRDGTICQDRDVLFESARNAPNRSPATHKVFAMTPNACAPFYRMQVFATPLQHAARFQSTVLRNPRALGT